MPQEPREPTQKTQPKGIDPKTGKPYKPVDVPVPRREAIDQLFKRAAKSASDLLDRNR